MAISSFLSQANLVFRNSFNLLPIIIIQIAFTLINNCFLEFNQNNKPEELFKIFPYFEYKNYSLKDILVRLESLKSWLHEAQLTDSYHQLNKFQINQIRNYEILKQNYNLGLSSKKKVSRTIFLIKVFSIFQQCDPNVKEHFLEQYIEYIDNEYVHCLQKYKNSNILKLLYINYQLLFNKNYKIKSLKLLNEFLYTSKSQLLQIYGYELKVQIINGKSFFTPKIQNYQKMSSFVNTKSQKSKNRKDGSGDGRTNEKKNYTMAALNNYGSSISIIDFFQYLVNCATVTSFEFWNQFKNNYIDIHIIRSYLLKFYNETTQIDNLWKDEFLRINFKTIYLLPIFSKFCLLVLNKPVKSKKLLKIYLNEIKRQKKDLIIEMKDLHLKSVNLEIDVGIVLINLNKNNYWKITHVNPPGEIFYGLKKKELFKMNYLRLLEHPYAFYLINQLNPSENLSPIGSKNNLNQSNSRVADDINFEKKMMYFKDKNGFMYKGIVSQKLFINCYNGAKRQMQTVKRPNFKIKNNVGEIMVDLRGNIINHNSECIYHLGFCHYKLEQFKCFTIQKLLYDYMNYKMDIDLIYNIKSLDKKVLNYFFYDDDDHNNLDDGRFVLESGKSDNNMPHNENLIEETNDQKEYNHSAETMRALSDYVLYTNFIEKSSINRNDNGYGGVLSIKQKFSRRIPGFKYASPMAVIQEVDEDDSESSKNYNLKGQNQSSKLLTDTGCQDNINDQSKDDEMLNEKDLKHNHKVNMTVLEKDLITIGTEDVRIKNYFYIIQMRKIENQETKNIYKSQNRFDMKAQSLKNTGTGMNNNNYQTHGYCNSKMNRQLRFEFKANIKFGIVEGNFVFDLLDKSPDKKKFAEQNVIEEENHEPKNETDEVSINENGININGINNNGHTNINDGIVKDNYLNGDEKNLINGVNECQSNVEPKLFIDLNSLDKDSNKNFGIGEEAINMILNKKDILPQCQPWRKQDSKNLVTEGPVITYHNTEDNLIDHNVKAQVKSVSSISKKSRIKKTEQNGDNNKDSDKESNNEESGKDSDSIESNSMSYHSSQIDDSDSGETNSHKDNKSNEKNYDTDSSSHYQTVLKMEDFSDEDNEDECNVSNSDNGDRKIIIDYKTCDKISMIFHRLRNNEDAISSDKNVEIGNSNNSDVDMDNSSSSDNEENKYKGCSGDTNNWNSTEKLIKGLLTKSGKQFLEEIPVKKSYNDNKDNNPNNVHQYSLDNNQIELAEYPKPGDMGHDNFPKSKNSKLALIKNKNLERLRATMPYSSSNRNSRKSSAINLIVNELEDDNSSTTSLPKLTKKENKLMNNTMNEEILEIKTNRKFCEYLVEKSSVIKCPKCLTFTYVIVIIFILYYIIYRNTLVSHYKKRSEIVGDMLLAYTDLNFAMNTILTVSLDQIYLRNEVPLLDNTGNYFDSYQSTCKSSIVDIEKSIITFQNSIELLKDNENRNFFSTYKKMKTNQDINLFDLTQVYIGVKHEGSLDIHNSTVYDSINYMVSIYQQFCSYPIYQYSDTDTKYQVILDNTIGPLNNNFNKTFYQYKHVIETDPLFSDSHLRYGGMMLMLIIVTMSLIYGYYINIRLNPSIILDAFIMLNDNDYVNLQERVQYFHNLLTLLRNKYKMEKNHVRLTYMIIESYSEHKKLENLKINENILESPDIRSKDKKNKKYSKTPSLKLALFVSVVLILLYQTLVRSYKAILYKNLTFYSDNIVEALQLTNIETNEVMFMNNLLKVYGYDPNYQLLQNYTDNAVPIQYIISSTKNNLINVTQAYFNSVDNQYDINIKEQPDMYQFFSGTYNGNQTCVSYSDYQAISPSAFVANCTGIFGGMLQYNFKLSLTSSQKDLINTANNMMLYQNLPHIPYVNPLAPCPWSGYNFKFKNNKTCNLIGTIPWENNLYILSIRMKIIRKSIDIQIQSKSSELNEIYKPFFYSLIIIQVVPYIALFIVMFQLAWVTRAENLRILKSMIIIPLSQIKSRLYVRLKILEFLKE